MKKLYKEKAHEPRCEYCVWAVLPEDRSVALCRFYGVVDLGGKCRRYKYDPLKRIPAKVRLSGDYSEEDFKL